MPSPSAPLKQTRPDLGTFRQFDLDMQQKNYIGLRIMPRFDVPRHSGTFGKIKLSELLSAGDAKLERAALSGFVRSKWEFEEAEYRTKERGYEEPIDDREEEIYSDFFESEVMAAQRATEMLFHDYERRIIAKSVDETVTAGQSADAGTPWDDHANADPRADVRAAAERIWSRTGLWPNTLVVGRHKAFDLLDNENLISRVASGGAGSSTLPGQLNEQVLAQYFGVDQVLVSDAIKLSSGETISSIFPQDKALLLKAGRSLDIKEPCFGRTFVYTGLAGDFDPVPETYREENVLATIVRVRHESEEKVLYPEMAEVITGLVTV